MQHGRAIVRPAQNARIFVISVIFLTQNGRFAPPSLVSGLRQNNVLSYQDCHKIMSSHWGVRQWRQRARTKKDRRATTARKRRVRREATATKCEAVLFRGREELRRHENAESEEKQRQQNV